MHYGSSGIYGRNVHEHCACINAEVCVPMVCVLLVQALKPKPEESVVAEVKLVGDGMNGGGGLLAAKQLLLLESERGWREETWVQIAGTITGWIC